MFNKKEMFQAICSECGQECEVPFRPTGDKPVLCSSCFGKQKDRYQDRSGGRRQGRSDDRNFSRSDDRRMYTAVCDKCGKTAEVPFKPSGDKPVYCSECFQKENRRDDRRGRDRRGGRDNDGGMLKQLSEQIKSVSNKMDRMISLLETGAEKKEPAKKESAKKSETKKPAKKAVKKAAKKKK